MKLRIDKNRRASGHALMLVMVFLLLALVVLGATMRWTTTNARLIERSNEYFTTVAAAEAATEKVMSEMETDYQQQGSDRVNTKLGTYRTRRPLASEHPGWSRFSFSAGDGSADHTRVVQVAPWGISSLISQYRGLSGYASTFQVTSAAQAEGGYDIAAAVQQEFQIGTIPVFQFAIFYNIDLEICPGPVMTVKGRVHSNRNLYAQPQDVLTFNGDVTSAGNIVHGKKPGDPTGRTVGTIVYGGEHDSGVLSLALPLGVENTVENVRQIVEKPPVGELANSSMGKQRFYNKSDLIVEVYDNRVEVKGGLAAGTSFPMAYSDVSSFVKTNVSFFNKRENKTVKTTEIDVGKLKLWTEAGNSLKTALGRDISSIWVADWRTQTASTEPGIRMVNGQTLPSRGLTVSTPDPLYVKGHYNVPSADVGTDRTANTKPAAFVADAVTVLSGSWNDSASSSSLSSRIAGNTTVNAAFMAGIVETTEGSYSGGVENFPRFLEDWAGRTLTYNGSMIVMFPSRYGTGTWKGTGTTYGIYNPPARNWTFDMNFLNPSRLPPGTPEARSILRGSWKLVAANNGTVGAN